VGETVKPEFSHGLTDATSAATVECAKIDEGTGMANGNELISEDMLHKVEATAREQSREPAEVVEEALGRYFASQRLEKLGSKLQERALAKGIREEDVPELVHQVRRENAERGR
jgi:hypothetical protein